MTCDFFAVADSHTLQSLIAHHAIHSPNVFCIFPESKRVVSFRELEKKLRMFGGRLRNVAPHSPVGAMCGNGWAALQILLGAPYHGRAAMILNLTAGDSQLAYMIRHSDCRLIFADNENFSRLQNIAKQCENEIEIVQVDRDEDIGGDDVSLPFVNAVSPALLIYTSGTTGKPKGVLHSHRSLLFGGANTAAAHRLSAADRALCVLPLYHINGQCVTVFAPLISGGAVVIPHKFSARQFWQQSRENKCTWFSAVPTILSHLLHGESPSEKTQMRFGRSASSALSPETHRQFEKKFFIPLVETMGLTETAAQILSNPPPPQKGKYGSPGIAFGNEVQIVNAAGESLPPNTAGEIAVRGDNLMLGYLRENAPFSGGWFMTGDLGRMDSDGYVFVTGRKKELIIKGGENIAPREIDDALYAAAGVVEAAAFAVPCEIYGQQTAAAVVLESPDAHSENDLIALCQKTIGKFKSPSRIYFMNSLPKGPSGKIQRSRLAKMIQDAKH